MSKSDAVADSATATFGAPSVGGSPSSIVAIAFAAAAAPSSLSSDAVTSAGATTPPPSSPSSSSIDAAVAAAFDDFADRLAAAADARPERVVRRLCFADLGSAPPSIAWERPAWMLTSLIAPTPRTSRKRSGSPVRLSSQYGAYSTISREPPAPRRFCR